MVPAQKLIKIHNIVGEFFSGGGEHARLGGKAAEEIGNMVERAPDSVLTRQSSESPTKLPSSRTIPDASNGRYMSMTNRKVSRGF
jgi:hypothetical protein